MSERSVTHATFFIERVYDATPARVFAAWADPAAKARWSDCHEDWLGASDFRVGGREQGRGGPPGGPVYANDTHYLDIVPDQRIVYAYGFTADDVMISASLVTVEFKADGSRTRMTFTEQGAYLDGHETPANREHGTRLALEQIEIELTRSA